MVKIKKADNLSMCNDKENIGENEDPRENSRLYPLIYREVVKKSPLMAPTIAKKLLHRLARVLFFLKNNDPMAPIKNSDKVMIKIFCRKIMLIMNVIYRV